MTTVFDQTAILTGTDDGDGNSNLNLRQQIVFTLLGAATGDQIRITFRFGTGEPTETPAIDDCFCGRAALVGNAYDFNGNQVRVTVAGSNNINGSAGGVVVSDIITFAGGEVYDQTKTLVFAYHVKNGASCNFSIAGLTGANVFFDNGGASTAGNTTTTLSNVLANNLIFVDAIEILSSGGGDTLFAQSVM